MPFVKRFIQSRFWNESLSKWRACWIFRYLHHQSPNSVCDDVDPRLIFSLVFPDDVSDDFFEVTVNDLRLMLKDLKNERYL